MRCVQVGAALVVALVAARAAAAADNFGLGDGHSGPLSITTPGNMINSYAQVSSNVAAGDTTISVSSTAGFAVNDLILAGHHQQDLARSRRQPPRRVPDHRVGPRAAVAHRR